MSDQPLCCKFRSEQRLKTAAEFRRVFDARLSAADDCLIVYGQPRVDGCGAGRLGLSVSRKIGGAVVRNAWKRRIREAFRQSASRYQGWDWIVIPRRGSVCDGHRIAQSLAKLAERLRHKQRRRRS